MVQRRSTGSSRRTLRDASTEPIRTGAAPAFSAARSSVWIHYALVEPDAAAAVSRRIVWLAPPDAQPDVVVSLAGSWAIGGVYVFLGKAAGTDRALLAALRSRLEGAPPDTRFAWVDDPSAPPSTWSAPAVRVAGATETGAVVRAAATLGTGGYALVLDKGCTVAPRDDGAGFAFGGDGTGTAHLRVPAGDPLLLAAGVGLAVRGPDAGALSFAVTVGGPGSGPDPLAALDAGVRFYHPAPTPPPNRGRRTQRPEAGTLRYPVLDLRRAPVTLRGTLDPADLLSPRSALAFAADCGPLASHFRTVTGRPLTMTPGEGAGFRFAPLGPGSAEDRSLTLAPAGPFTLGGTEGATELLCGTSGVEYIELPPEGATLRFVPGCPAWAPLFDPDGSLAPEAASAPRLDSSAVTSWVAISAPAPLRYFAQPRDAVLHRAGADGLLEYFPVAAGTLPAGADDESALPLVPYAGVDGGSAARAAGLETEVLAPERRERVYGLTAAEGPTPSVRAPAGPGDGDITAVTPGGWVATFGADGDSWRSLVLARLGDTGIVLEDIVDPLRAALLTSGQFLVVSDPASVAPHLDEHARLVVDGWTFDLHPREWGRHGTILIVKSCARALAELVEDVGTWSLPEAFNRSPAATQRELEGILEDARTRARTEKEDPDAADAWGGFVRSVLDDPSWSGWLALRCPVPPGALPPALSELAAGIDQDRFRAHHLGIHQTPVPPPGQPPADSAVFGLIAYDDPPVPRPDRAHAFQVTGVHVSFAASAVRDFSARIALQVGRLFGARARLRGVPGPPLLLLEGTRQRQGDGDVYVFRNAAEAVLDLDDRALAAVRITRCELGPGAAAAGPGSDRERVVARFGLGGALAFHPLPARSRGYVDLLGYDALPFSGLALEMRFPVDAPREQSFDLDLSGLAFDPTAASVRSGSLPGRFPLRPRGMISSDSAGRPADLGWSAVAVPDLDAGALSGSWFGLVFDLDLGTPGALAEAAGLAAGMALLWSPSTDGPAAEVGLRLPGASSGSSGFSLMDVIDLNVHRQRLLSVDGGWLLKLTGMTLGFLGKSLPLDGTFDMLLFGDPAGEGGSGPLGWYGAYRRSARDEPGVDESGGRLRLSAPGGAAAVRPAGEPAGVLGPGGDDAPPPAWWGRPWAWTLITTTEEET